jgi:hypothetical protein
VSVADMYRLEWSAGGDRLMDENDIGSSFRKDLRNYFLSNLVNLSLNYLERNKYLGVQSKFRCS